MGQSQALCAPEVWNVLQRSIPRRGNEINHQRHSQYVTESLQLHSSSNRRVDWCDRGGIVGRGVLVDWVRWQAAITVVQC